jgi:chaperone LolA
MLSTIKRLIMITSIGVMTAHADTGVLSNFLQNAKTMKADFTQTVNSGKKAQTMHGTLEISRPNKFRWEYTTEQQLIISDSKRIYIYDKPLMQVTVKELDKSIDKSPAALLAGVNDINQMYKVTAETSTDQGLSWVKIEPKVNNDNNGFQVVRMGFDKQRKLAAMRFTDSFGNQTKLQFSNVVTGISINPHDFEFSIPPGVDVAQQ